MFDRNTWLTRQAFDVLGSDDQFRLYELEDLVLEREQVWPGCTGLAPGLQRNRQPASTSSGP